MVEGIFVLKENKTVTVVQKKFEALDYLMNYKDSLTNCITYRAYEYRNYGKRKSKEERALSRLKKKDVTEE